MSRRKHGTLTAATVATVTLTGACSEAEIVNRGTSGDIFATTDGTAPTVNGDDNFVIPPGGFLVVPARDTDGDGNTTVKLISSGTPSYSVESL